MPWKECHIMEQKRCATPRQSLIQFDDCCAFSTAATVPVTFVSLRRRRRW